MSYIVVDASIFVSYLVSEDRFHVLCKNWLNKERSNDVILVSPSLMLVEVAGAISRRTGNSQLAERTIHSFNHLNGLRLVGMNQTLVEAGAILATRLGLRGADAIYVAVAQELNIPLATLDSDQRTRAANAVRIENL